MGGGGGARGGGESTGRVRAGGSESTGKEEGEMRGGRGGERRDR